MAATSPAPAARSPSLASTVMDATSASVAPAPRPSWHHLGGAIGRYQILHVLGRGGMGAVYAAYDPELGRTVAIKVLRAGRGGPDELARLVREGRAIARLAHPNVVAVHDVGTHHEMPFVAMEHVTGPSFDRWLAATPRTWQQALPLVIQAGAGLAAAHAAGVVHRDFKPGNVLVGADGRARVSDFGLARFADDGPREPTAPDAGADVESASDLTLPGTRMGTPAYMSPEQDAGLEVDARSDQYSFAVAAYEATTGVRPFPGPRRAADQPLAEGAAIPARLRAALARALALEPADRFPTMAPLLEELRAVDPSDPRTQGQAAMVAATRLTRRWRAYVIGSVIAALVVTTTAGIGLTLRAQHQRDRARAAEQDARAARQLVDAQLIAALRAQAADAYARGDLAEARRHVRALLRRGVDDPAGRMIVGATSWAWPLERATYEDVRDIRVAAGRVLLIRSDDALVVDTAGRELLRRALPMDVRGLALSPRGDAVLIQEGADLIRIELDAGARERVLATDATRQGWHLPEVVGDGAVVRAGGGVVAIDARGVAAPVIPLGASIRLLARADAILDVVDERTRRIDLRTGAISSPWPGPFEAANALADGGLVLTTPDGLLRVLDARGRERTSIATGPDMSRLDLVDDERAVVGASDRALHVWELASGALRATIPRPRPGPWRAVDDDVWLGTDHGVVSRYDLHGTHLGDLDGPGGPIEELHVTEDALVVVAGARARVYHRPPPRARVERDACGPAARVTRLFHLRDAEARVCSDGQLRRGPAPAPGAPGFGTAETTDWVFADRGGVIASLFMDRVELHAGGGAPTSLAVRMDTVTGVGVAGGRFIYADAAGLHVVDPRTLARHAQPPLAGPAVAGLVEAGAHVVALLRDGQLVSLAWRGDALVESARRTPPRPPMLLAPAAGDAIAAADEQAVVLLSTSTLTPRLAAAIPVPGAEALALSADATRLAVVTRSEQLRLFDATTGAPLLDLPLGGVRVRDLAFTADGRALRARVEGALVTLPLPDHPGPAAALARALDCHDAGELRVGLLRWPCPVAAGRP